MLIDFHAIDFFSRDSFDGMTWNEGKQAYANFKTACFAHVDVKYLWQGFFWDDITDGFS